MAWPGASGAAGGTVPAVFNAANEECVGRVPRPAACRFLGIVDTVEPVVDEWSADRANDASRTGRRDGAARRGLGAAPGPRGLGLAGSETLVP